MKKRTGRLTLSRETLKRLSEPVLSQAAGGSLYEVTESECDNLCIYPSRYNLSACRVCYT
jgi:hypothetical protein